MSNKSSWAGLAAATALLVFPSLANSQSFSPYIEGQLGRTQVQDADGATTVSGSGFNAAVNVTLEYDASISYGAEVGFRNIGGTGIRAGLSFNTLKAKFDKGTVSAALSHNGTVVASGAASFTKADAEAAGVDLDNNVNTYSLNAYYDFDIGGKFAPYVGAGVGIADIEHADSNELALSLHAGANYAFTDKIYAGLKASYHRVEGPTDKFGINYDDVTAYTVGVVLGYRF